MHSTQSKDKDKQKAKIAKLASLPIPTKIMLENILVDSKPSKHLTKKNRDIFHHTYERK
jgi:hypothetical protein